MLPSLFPANKGEIEVKTISDGITLSCKVGKIKKESETVKAVASLELTYLDENTGEYECVDDDNTTLSRIYVKFRCKCLDHSHLQCNYEDSTS